jgi:protein-arginine kinase activator protein McsA
MDMASIHMGEDGVVTETQKENNHKERNTKDMVTVESLEKMLEKAVSNEEYEIASQLKNRIDQLRSV